MGMHTVAKNKIKIKTGRIRRISIITKLLHIIADAMSSE
jgi:hypothetical protein